MMRVYRNSSNLEEYLMELAQGYQLSQVLFTAHHLNLFTFLHSRALTLPVLARKLKCDFRFLERLVKVLIALDLLVEENGKVTNTPIASSYLVRGGNYYLGNVLHHLDHLRAFWEHLPEQVKKGQKRYPGRKYLREYPHRLRDFLAAMADIAILKAPIIAHRLSIGRYRKMLDVGTGPGTYALIFAQKNPSLQCVLVDLEPNLRYTEKMVIDSGVQDRVVLYPCELLHDHLPRDEYDLIFVSNLIHLYSSVEVKKILQKLWKCAGTPATIAIHDYFIEDKRYRPISALLFDLTMLVGTPRGRCYTIEAMSTMFTRLGAHTVKHIPVSLGSSLVVAEK